MDIDTMHRQVSELMAFKAMALPMLAQMQEFMASHQTDQGAEVDTDDQAATEDKPIGAAEDHAETEQHDG